MQKRIKRAKYKLKIHRSIGLKNHNPLKKVVYIQQRMFQETDWMFSIL